MSIFVSEMIPHDKKILQEFKDICKILKIHIHYMKDMGSFIHVDITGEIDDIEKIRNKIKEWEKYQYESTWFYKIMKFLKLN